MRRMLLLAGLCAGLLSAEARAYVLMEGPMPTLGAPKPATGGTGFEPAPLPDVDARAPVERRGRGAVISPELINRKANRTNPANGFSAGSDFSDSMTRRGKSATNLGSTLAPGVTIRQPIQ